MNKLGEFFFNPFLRIGGLKALIIGVAISFITTFIGAYSHIHFPDIISVKIGLDFTFLFLIIQSSINWIVMGVLLFVTGFIITKTKFRFIDVIGNQALARYPFLFAAMLGFVPGIDKFALYIMNSQLDVGEPVSISDFEIGMAILSIIIMMGLSIWGIILMYKGFSISVNAKGIKAIVAFVVVLIIAFVITNLNFRLMMQYNDFFIQ